MADAALVSLEQTLNQVLNRDHSPIIHPLNPVLLSMYERVYLLQSFLRFPEVVRNFEGRIRDVANKAKEILVNLLFDDNPSDNESINPSVRWEAKLREAAEEIESVAKDAIDFHEFELTEAAEEIQWDFYVGDLSFSRTSARDVIGLEEDLIVMKDRLYGESSKLQVLPILGIGGIGKTTLARIVYDDYVISEYFSFRVWVTISQEYSVKSIHSKLLASMNVNEIVDVECEEEKIRKYLKSRRYLIVIDDMWNKKVWDELKMLFPDNHNGSRILLTTRLPDVAAYPDPYGPIHEMRLLDEEESWNLLNKKAFSKRAYPLELEDIGRQIAKTSGGLPLSIVLVAGLLSSIGQARKFWEQIAANDGKLETILCLSYSHLPPDLRACFLYMGGFPEDYDIPTSELIRLWAAEGFLQRPRNEELEVTAESYLNYLARRSLVLISSMKSDGGIKSCSLHDMVHDFCIRQAQKEKLHLSVMDHLPTPILRRHFLPRVLKNHRRLSLTSHDLNVNNSMHGSHIRTIICIPQRGYKSVGSVEKFNSLRVMHVLRGGNDVWDWELGRVFSLIHLTYLAFHLPTSVVPPTISLLQNLQSLIIYRYDVCLPVEIWRLQRLRHLIAFSFHSLPYMEEEEVFPLKQLETLSMAKNFVCSRRMMIMFPNVKKLGICLCEEKSDKGYHLHNLQDLIVLEKLKLEMCLDTSVGPSLHNVFRSCLRKLTLSGLRIPWRGMTTSVGLLPYLKVLKLRNYACDGDCWETNDNQFKSLEVLLIDGSNLRRWITKKYHSPEFRHLSIYPWTTKRYHFPKLRHLSIYRCPYLSEIPRGIAKIPTNAFIEVDDQNTALLQFIKLMKIENTEEEEEEEEEEEGRRGGRGRGRRKRRRSVHEILIYQRRVKKIPRTPQGGGEE